MRINGSKQFISCASNLQIKDKLGPNAIVVVLLDKGSKLEPLDAATEALVQPVALIPAIKLH